MPNPSVLLGADPVRYLVAFVTPMMAKDAGELQVYDQPDPQ
jgi:hypothetical protein